MIDNTSQIIPVRRPAMADNLRQLMVANAMSIVDVCAADPRTRPILEELLGMVNGGHWDLDRPFRCWQDDDGKWRTEGVSTCGLVAEGLWRRCGVEADWLHTPYGAGGRFDSITRAMDLAQRLRPRSAWHLPRDGQRPEPGDYLVIGAHLSTHALTCVGWEEDTLVSVDGGQTGARGLQAVHLCRRPWRSTGGHATLDNRQVIGWVALEMLPGVEDCVGPTGYEGARVHR